MYLFFLSTDAHQTLFPQHDEHIVGKSDPFDAILTSAAKRGQSWTTDCSLPVMPVQAMIVAWLKQLFRHNVCVHIRYGVSLRLFTVNLNSLPPLASDILSCIPILD